jgi:single-stranded-DNA-specific exonuclease
MIGFLTNFKHYFVAFWWHKQAAGFTILKEHFADFCRDIEEHAGTIAHERPESKTIKVDAILPLEAIDLQLVQDIQAFKPFGIGNPKPVFMIENISTKDMEYLWKEQKHIRFMLSKNWVNSKAFWIGEYFEQIKEAGNISIIAELEENNWNGRVTVDLNVKDIVFRI